MSRDPSTARSFGRYQLLERLAVGGMAEIFKARSHGRHGFGKTVVVKRILPQFAKDAEFVDMFVNEAKVMVRLDHPKIVQVFDFGEVDGQCYIAMEYVEGIDGLTLLRRCAQRQCRPATAVSVYIIAAILDALDYAHRLCDERGEPLRIVHRDISPSNIFIAKTGDIKLGDFGIARGTFRRRKTDVGVLKGKYGYMAPEQVSGGLVDGRADIFAAAIVLAEFLMIRRMFVAGSDLDLLLQVRDARLDRLHTYGRRIPDALRAILETALARDAANRFQQADVFRDALHRFLLQSGRMIRNTDAAKFLRGLMATDAPLRQARPDSWEAPAVVARQVISDLSRATAGDGPARVAEPHARALSTDEALAAVPEMARSPKSSLAEFRPVATSHDADALFTTEKEASPTVVEVPDVVAVRFAVDHGGNADQSGDLRQDSLFRLCATLAHARETGLLRLYRGETIKQVFWVGGIPEVVTSNRPTELLGQVLVRQGVISEGELAMALAVLPRFGGKLGSALASLRLVTPVDMLRHLSAQVRENFVEAFLWPEGRYAYFRGRRCLEESAPLGLDAFTVIGLAAMSLPETMVRERLSPLWRARLVATHHPSFAPEMFGLGDRPRAVCRTLSGQHTLAELLNRFDDDRKRLAFLRTVYMLCETGFAVPK